MINNRKIRSNLTGVLNIYEYKIHEILEPRKPKNTYIFAGRGLGKSTFLHHLEKHLLVKNYKCNLLKYDISSFKKFLYDYDFNKEKQKFALLIDDFDRFFMELIESEPSNFVEILNISVKLKYSVISGSENLIIPTGRATPSDLLKFIRDKAIFYHIDKFIENESVYSHFFLDWEHSPLIPWHPNWKEYLKAKLGGFFKGSLNEEVMQGWNDVICDLTGGHPTLIGICKEAFELLIRDYRDINNDIHPIASFERKLLQKPVIKKNISRYLEDTLVNKGLGIFNRVLDHLKAVDHGTYLLAIDTLRRMVEKSKYDPQNTKIRGILINNGLIYKDSITGEYQLISKILIDTLKEEELSKNEYCPQFSLRPMQRIQDQERGELIIKKLDGDISIAFRDSQWRLVRLLISREGEIIPHNQIQLEAGIPSLEALRSTVNRVTQKLKEFGFSNLIKNVHGKGYVLNQK